VSVMWDIFSYEVHIMTDAGRTCRPLLSRYSSAVSDAPVGSAYHEPIPHVRSWSQLISGTLLPLDELPGEFSGGSACVPHDVLIKYGAARDADDVEAAIGRLRRDMAPIELIDTEEMRGVLVCSDRSRAIPGYGYTHDEIHPALMFSPMTASIPMLNHNPSAYNSLCLAQTKQGLGMYCTNYRHRMDVLGTVLHSAQLPLVTTYFADKIAHNKFTHGENVVIAIMTYTGYNQEDAIILNTSSVERGLLNISVYSTHEFREDTYWDGVSPRVIFANPLESLGDSDVRGIRADRDYSSLDGRGLPRLGQWVSEGRALVGMCRLEQSSDQRIVSDVTEFADRTVWGKVDQVYVTEGPVGTRSVKVRLHEVRPPSIGDKLSSRFGQKGLVGMIMPHVDMPFSADGLVPDVIINPHGFPGRKTITHLLEALLGPMACSKGRRLDATSFEPFNPIDAVRSYFTSAENKSNWSCTGNVTLYNGSTGDQISTEIFVGMNYYNRLKHMSVDKINYRSTGPRNFMTHQPTQGRGNAGGLKIGEMERDCVLTHGATCFLKESFFNRSDPFHVQVDEHTGHIASHNKGSQVPSGTSALVRTPLPYSFKQFATELQAMSIGTKLLLEQ
jgi:DNA-directed RNA polymerase beta subunit